MRRIKYVCLNWPINFSWKCLYNIKKEVHLSSTLRSIVPLKDHFAPHPMFIQGGPPFREPQSLLVNFYLMETIFLLVSPSEGELLSRLMGTPKFWIFRSLILRFFEICFIHFGSTGYKWRPILICSSSHYFLWGYVKSFVYVDKPCTIETLQDIIT